VRAVLRRASGASTGDRGVCFDDVEIDLERRMVTRGGELVDLSRTEWLLLQHLAANAGKVVLHTELLTKVWGPEYRDDLQYLRVWVSRVRRKLGAKPGEPGRIKTFQGIGYLLDVEPGHVVEPEHAEESSDAKPGHPPASVRGVTGSGSSRRQPTEPGFQAVIRAARPHRSSIAQRRDKRPEEGDPGRLLHPKTPRHRRLRLQSYEEQFGSVVCRA
jgi:DNA-binding winged helix-turn-helix (wHTH) protein